MHGKMLRLSSELQISIMNGSHWLSDVEGQKKKMKLKTIHIFLSQIWC